MKREIGIDFLRVFATIAVIIVHVSAQNLSSVEVCSNMFYLFSIANGFARWCVPVFLMISGYLFLGKEITIKRLYTKYIWRMVYVVFFWSGMYAVIAFINGCGIGAALGQFITGHYHLWYLYMIIGIYALIPIVNNIVSDDELEKYLLIVSLIFGIFLPTINTICSIKLIVIHSWLDTILDNISMPLASCFLFYFILGNRIMKEGVSDKKRRLIYVGAVISSVFSIVLTIIFSRTIQEPFMGLYEYNSVFVMFEAIGWTLAIMELRKICISEKVKRVIIFLSENTFGVYLIHPMVIDALKGVFGIDTMSFPPIVSLFVITSLVISISFSIVVVLKRVPIIKRFCT